MLTLTSKFCCLWRRQQPMWKLLKARGSLRLWSSSGSRRLFSACVSCFAHKPLTAQMMEGLTAGPTAQWPASPSSSSSKPGDVWETPSPAAPPWTRVKLVFLWFGFSKNGVKVGVRLTRETHNRFWEIYPQSLQSERNVWRTTKIVQKKISQMNEVEFSAFGNLTWHSQGKFFLISWSPNLNYGVSLGPREPSSIWRKPVSQKPIVLWPPSLFYTPALTHNSSVTSSLYPPAQFTFTPLLLLQQTPPLPPCAAGWPDIPASLHAGCLSLRLALHLWLPVSYPSLPLSIPPSPCLSLPPPVYPSLPLSIPPSRISLSLPASLSSGWLSHFLHTWGPRNLPTCGHVRPPSPSLSSLLSPSPGDYSVISSPPERTVHRGISSPADPYIPPSPCLSLPRISSCLHPPISTCGPAPLFALNPTARVGSRSTRCEDCLLSLSLLLPLSLSHSHSLSLSLSLSFLPLLPLSLSFCSLSPFSLSVSLSSLSLSLSLSAPKWIKHNLQDQLPLLERGWDIGFSGPGPCCHHPFPHPPTQTHTHTRTHTTHTHTHTRGSDPVRMMMIVCCPQTRNFMHDVSIKRRATHQYRELCGDWPVPWKPCRTQSICALFWHWCWRDVRLKRHA